MAPHKTKCCKVAGCKNQRSSDDVLLHSVPRGKKQLRKWMLALHLRRLPQTSFICRDHFTSDDYIKAADNEPRLLKQEAVPSQNIPPETDKKQNQSKRPLKKRQRSDVSESDSTSMSISDGFSSSDDEPVVKTSSSPRIKVVDTKKLLNKSKNSRVKMEPAECKTAAAFICMDPIKYEDDVPAIEDEVEDRMVGSDIKACLLCLSSTAPLAALAPLADTYRLVTGARMPGGACACAWCACALRRFAELRARGRRAQEVLRWLSGRGELKQENIEEVARSSFNLIPPLTAKHFEPNHFDKYYNADEPIPVPPPVGERLKQENIVQQLDNHECRIVTDDDFDATEHIKSDDTAAADEIPKKKVKKRKKSSKTAEKVVRNGATKAKNVENKEPSKNEIILSKYMDMKVLTVEEARAEIDKRMESNNFKHAQYKCAMCGKTFEYEQICAKHMRLHDTISGSYSCEVCQLRYPTKNQLTKHNKSSHKFLFNCRKCDFQSHCRIRSIRHLDRHEGTIYNCKHCDAHFVCHTSLLGHLRIRHPSNLACALCGYSFLSERGIKYHQNLAHKHSDRQIPPDGPRCEECDVRFVDAHAHQTHLRVSAAHATGKLKYNSSHISNSEPRPRRKRMAPDVNIACEQCGLKMSSFLEYRKHFLRAHPYKKRALLSTTEGDVLCELCGATFTSKAVLKEHMAKHLGLGHTCDVCGRTYSTKHSLIAHRRKHEGVKYGCDTCGKQFSQQSNRERHVRYAHSDVKSVACEICGKCFKHVGSRNFHMSHVHLKKPWPKRGARDRQTDRRRRASETEQPLWASRAAPALVQ